MPSRMCPVNMFSEAVVGVLFCHECGLVSWRVYPLKLTTKPILHSNYVLRVINLDLLWLGGCCWSATKCKKCEMSTMGYITLLHNRMMTIGLIYTWILLCGPFGFVSWWLYRLCSAWGSRWVMHNGIILYRYNYSEIADVLFLGGHSW